MYACHVHDLSHDGEVFARGRLRRDRATEFPVGTVAIGGEVPGGRTNHRGAIGDSCASLGHLV